MFVGGPPAKLAAKYGLRWGKAAESGRRISALGGELIDGIKGLNRADRKLDNVGYPIGNSFTPGTGVVMADGSIEPIEDIDVGEKVLATDGHPFWVPGPGLWVDAIDPAPGMWLQTSSGTWVQVSAVQAWTQTATVHNLTVQGVHTYHVASGDLDVLNHNCNDDTHITPERSAHIEGAHVPDARDRDSHTGEFSKEKDIYNVAKQCISGDPAKGSLNVGSRFPPGARRLTEFGLLSDLFGCIEKLIRVWTFGKIESVPHWSGAAWNQWPPYASVRLDIRWRGCSPAGRRQHLLHLLCRGSYKA